MNTMLISELYKVIKHYKIYECQKDRSNNIFEIELNPAHKIFEGHFPQGPVLPGVVSIQIIKECCELLRGEPLSFSSIGQCKFPMAVNPVENRNIKLNISLLNNDLTTEGSSAAGVFIKLKAKLRK